MAINTRRHAVPPQPDRVPCDPDLLQIPDFSSAAYENTRLEYKRRLSNLDDDDIVWFMEQSWQIWTDQARIWWNTYSSNQASPSRSTPAPHSASVDPISVPVAGPSSAVDHGTAANQAQAGSGGSLAPSARSPNNSRPPSPIPSIQVLPPAPAVALAPASPAATVPAIPIAAIPAPAPVPRPTAPVVRLFTPVAPAAPAAFAPAPVASFAPPAAPAPAGPDPDHFQFGPDLLQDRRSTHVLHSSIETRLRKLQHVPLYHFTTRGLKNQVESYQQSVTDHSYHFEVVNGTSALVPAASSILSKKVPADEMLDLGQFREAQLNFLAAIRNVHWPAEVIDMWDDFFHNILSHPANLNPSINGQHPLMVYLARIRTMWHNELERTNVHPYVNRVDETMFNQILQELQAAQHQKQVQELQQLMSSAGVSPFYLPTLSSTAHACLLFHV